MRVKPLLHDQISSNSILSNLAMLQVCRIDSPFLHGQILSNHNQLESNIKQLYCCFATNIEDQVTSAAILIVLVLKDE